MIKHFIILFFGIACSVGYSQVNESSFSYVYSQDTSDFAVEDTLFDLGVLNISFSIDDTLNFKGVQVQFFDHLDNLLMNKVELKNGLISSGIYSNGNIDLHIGTVDKTPQYKVKLIYLNISGIHDEPKEFIISN